MARVSIDKDGFFEADARLRGIERRLTHSEPGMERLLDIQEEQEVAHFASLHGQFIRTGRTMESLTQPFGNDSIREAHSSGATFGTRVPYSVYLRKRHESGVLKTTQRSRKKMARSLLDFFSRGRV